MEHHILEADNITKAFGDRDILSSIYLKVQTGDISALFGRNGAGKSTLLKILFGSLNADNKFIRIDDQYSKTPYKESAKISYLPESPFTPNNLKVRQIFDMYEISKMRVGQQITQFWDCQIADLSSGERRYIENNLILLKDAHFVLLDEPFKFLSPLMIQEVRKLIISESDRKGIIITDHNYRNVLDTVNRIFLIRDGELYNIENEKGLAAKGYIY
ncbi:ATP-binding cassette domain-containing protein [Dysgonomonas sp. Marseille-P4361]|uniref:ATP-binding cassette domain-containing protein n=1 Tax=Dysgonomonas sp. Marseille-P4361 TaxID=2161820 RepID=UPI000D5546B4|nr:ATP-binding cassette domain-containing protein [Dysgonomonas sp. Marseille-P4361]